MAVCTSCGNSIADGTMYCPHCGTPVGTPASAPPGYAPVGQGAAPANVPPPSGYSNVNYGAAPPNTPPPAGYPPAGYGVPASGSTGLQENVAGLLCYVLGWITGLIFFFIDKRPFVRFHAAQSIILFGGLHLLAILVHIIFGFGVFGGVGFWAGFSVLVLISSLINLLALVLWIVLMIMAYQGKRFEVPIVAEMAKQLAGKPI